MRDARKIAQSMLEFAQAWGDLCGYSRDESVAALVDLVASGQVRMWEEDGQMFYEGTRGRKPVETVEDRRGRV